MKSQDFVGSLKHVLVFHVKQNEWTSITENVREKPSGVVPDLLNNKARNYSAKALLSEVSQWPKEVATRNFYRMTLSGSGPEDGNAANLDNKRLTQSDFWKPLV